MFWDDTRMGNYQQQFDTIEFLLPGFCMENRNVLPGCRDKVNKGHGKGGMVSQSRIGQIFCIFDQIL